MAYDNGVSVQEEEELEAAIPPPAAVAVLLLPPLDGRGLVGLQTFKSRTRMGLSSLRPSAMMARPLNSLPFKWTVFHIGCQLINKTTQGQPLYSILYCTVHDFAKVARPDTLTPHHRRIGRRKEEGGHRTERRIEIVAALDPDPTRGALLEDFHMVHVADLSHIVFDLLPRHVEWKLQGSESASKRRRPESGFYKMHRLPHNILYNSRVK